MIVLPLPVLAVAARTAWRWVPVVLVALACWWAGSQIAQIAHERTRLRAELEQARRDLAASEAARAIERAQFVQAAHDRDLRVQRAEAAARAARMQARARAVTIEAALEPRADDGAEPDARALAVLRRYHAASRGVLDQHAPAAGGPASDHGPRAVPGAGSAAAGPGPDVRDAPAGRGR